MMIRHVLTGASVFLGFAVASFGCSSAQSVCQLICECQHCSDRTEEFTCAELEAQQASAEAYECGEKWEALLTCVEEKGTCNEKEADFTTRESGSCSDTQDIGGSCSTNADCQQGGGFPGNVTCSAGVCKVSVCTGSSSPCTSNDDCMGQGDDLCENEAEALENCIDAASGGAAPHF